MVAAGVIAIPVYGALMIRGVQAVIDNLSIHPAQGMPNRKISLSLQELDVLLLPATTLILALGALRPTVGHWFCGRSSGGGVVFMASLAALVAPYSVFLAGIISLVPLEPVPADWYAPSPSSTVSRRLWPEQWRSLRPSSLGGGPG